MIAPSLVAMRRTILAYLGLIGAILFARSCLVTNIDAGFVGVRYSNVTALNEEDLEPGWHLEIVGVHRISRLPAHYMFIEFSDQDMLSIRTKDNNIINVDVSIPYRIQPGEAWRVMKGGNHLQGNDGRFRFERFATDSAKDVLRSHLAQLRTEDFYNTDRRLEVSSVSLAALNQTLSAYHLEADQVLLRATYFRPEYEQQLAQIQLNEQTKLLNGAKSLVAAKRQELDNYNQGTVAQVAAKEQAWAKRIADLERAYQVGSVEVADSDLPGAARKRLVALSAETRAAIEEGASASLGIVRAELGDSHLLGIKNIEAETREYSQRVRAEADGVAARLDAEGEAKIARVQGEYEGRLNRMLDSAGGRAWVAYHAAEFVNFASELVFQSGEGIPAVYRLRDFALQFMGR